MSVVPSILGQDYSGFGAFWHASLQALVWRQPRGDTSSSVPSHDLTCSRRLRGLKEPGSRTVRPVTKWEPSLISKPLVGENPPPGLGHQTFLADFGGTLPGDSSGTGIADSRVWSGFLINSLIQNPLRSLGNGPEIIATEVFLCLRALDLHQSESGKRPYRILSLPCSGG